MRIIEQYIIRISSYLQYNYLVNFLKMRAHEDNYVFGRDPEDNKAVYSINNVQV